MIGELLMVRASLGVMGRDISITHIGKLKFLYAFKEAFFTLITEKSI